MREEDLTKQLHELQRSTVDATQYSITRFERVGLHIVVQVKYPSCRDCSYEGNKIMVFLSITEGEALMWRKIDPHFRDPKSPKKPDEAPSPAARFPATAEGWSDAVTWAELRKLK